MDLTLEQKELIKKWLIETILIDEVDVDERSNEDVILSLVGILNDDPESEVQKILESFPRGSAYLEIRYKLKEKEEIEKRGEGHSCQDHSKHDYSEKWVIAFRDKEDIFKLEKLISEIKELSNKWNIHIYLKDCEYIYAQRH